MKIISVTGQLLFDGGFWYLIAPSGVFHILSAHIPKNAVDGQEMSAQCEILPGYSGLDLDGRTSNR